MRIALVAPFRTTLNLDTYVAFAHPEALWELTRAACGMLEAHDGFPARPGRARRVNDGFLRYRAVAEDRTHWYSAPIAVVEPSAKALIASLRDVGAGGRAAALCEGVSARVALHDNTVAILTLEVDAPLSALTALGDATEVEGALTDLAHDAVTAVSAQIAERFARIMATNATRGALWPHREPIVKRPADFVAFDDVDAAVIEERPLRATMLWAHRVFALSDADERAWAERLEPPLAPDAQGVALGWGNSFLFDPAFLPRYLSLMGQAQVFYVLFELLAASQLRLLRGASAQGGAALAAPAVEAKVERLAQLFAELESEHLLFVESLQGPRRATVARIMAGFNFDDLKAACRVRLEFIERRLAHVERGREQVYRRLVSFVVIVVGGAQALQLTQDAFSFAGVSGSADPAPGVTDLMRALPVDVTLNLVALAILAAAAFWALRRAN